MNENILAFYSRVRGDEALISKLSEAPTVEDLIQSAMVMGQDMDLAFTQDEAVEGLNNIQTIIAETANDDELFDFELEIVSGGSIVVGGSTHQSGLNDV